MILCVVLSAIDVRNCILYRSIRRKGNKLRPFLLKAPVKDYIWGGTKLRELFGKESDAERLAESWELSCHPDGECIIDGGEFDGMKLSEFVAMHPEAVSSSFKKEEGFPVLVKLIDARNDLSVQVHPCDE